MAQSIHACRTFRRHEPYHKNINMSVALIDNATQSTVGAALRRFANKPAVVERCELCSAELISEHDHLMEPATRRLLCACPACAILFGYQAETKYRRVPRRIEALIDFHLTDAEWHALGIPIHLAFLFRSSSAGRVVAMYPSPAGCTESLLHFDSWDELTAENPILRELQPDVEALLINRVRSTRAYYRAPIDECFKLVGLVRAHWRGLSGGTEVWKHIDKFFASLNERAVKRS